MSPAVAPRPGLLLDSALQRIQRGQAGAREALQRFLLRVLDRCQQGFSLAHHIGALPRTSINNKFIYYKQAVEHPEVAAKLSYKQERAIALHNACRAGPCPDTSGIRPRPKRARDAFGPGMVFVVNTVLAWLMFSIDVRNSMLR